MKTGNLDLMGFVIKHFVQCHGPFHADVTIVEIMGSEKHALGARCVVYRMAGDSREGMTGADNFVQRFKIDEEQGSES